MYEYVYRNFYYFPNNRLVLHCPKNNVNLRSHCWKECNITQTVFVWLLCLIYPYVQYYTVQLQPLHCTICSTAASTDFMRRLLLAQINRTIYCENKIKTCQKFFKGSVSRDFRFRFFP